MLCLKHNALYMLRQNRVKEYLLRSGKSKGSSFTFAVLFVTLPEMLPPIEAF
ncbi:hypothetical protein PMH09_21200 [Roseofilum sp. BLCC_M143]|uniref:Uncharacterized protein n=1 Tax=Roseofilum casamattae BLCC-M143 TaxID=3022442 RepID=A0ABT7C337_9CYAN|nr:hypothetical protein [Roseofilum casamattae BLCC-M143]